MFWRKTSKGPQPPAPTVAPHPSDPPLAVDDVLDAAADILRALGKYAFAFGEQEQGTIAKAFERCAEHVLVAAPLDGTVAGHGPEASGGRREWRRLVRFVTEHRKKEQTYVERTTTEAREAIWALVDSLGRACVEHGKADDKLRAHAARLEIAAANESISELKQEATAFAASVAEYLAAQTERLAVEARDLRERLANLETQLDEARREGGTDALTMLANRRVFDATLAQQVALATVTARPLALVLVDIDNFKSVNDRHGHPAGDRVLREVADCLVRAFPRRSDLVARYGGEELAVILPDTTGENARLLADRMGAAVRARVIDAGAARLQVTVSAGIATLERGDAPGDLLERADRRLYAAKQAGRDRVVDRDPGPSEIAPLRRAS